MNLLDFTIEQGFPFSETTVKFMQGMMLQLQYGSLLGGSNYILSGCTVGGGTVTNGWMVLGGELLPFTGGAQQANVIVIETDTNKQFFGGASNPYYKTRTALFGSAATQYDFASLTRNDPANGVLNRLEKVEKMLKPLLGYTAGGVTVYGSWLFWGRPASEIPAGWEAVPDADWKGKVPVVLDATQTEFDTVGKVGGEKAHTLNRSELPNIRLKILQADGSTSYVNDAPGAGGSGVSLKGDNNGDNSAVPLQTEALGSSAAHNNLQPFKVVMFIRFAG